MTENNSLDTSWITTNRECNNRCRWCYAKSTNYKKSDLDYELAVQLIDLLKELEVKKVILLGGEPTLYKQLSDLIKRIIAYGMQPTLVTNGRKFCDLDYAKEIVDTGIYNIGISIKGANREQYSRLTSSDGYDEVIAGYQNLSKLGIEAACTVTLVDEVIQLIKELINNLAGAGIKHIHFDMGTPFVTKDSTEATGVVDPFVLTKAVENLLKIMEQFRIDFDINLNMPLCFFPDDIVEILQRKNQLAFFCQVQTKSGVVFDEKGEVLPCNAFPDYPIGKFGTDFKDADSFRKFWNSEEKEKLERVMSRYPSEFCIGCSRWEICRGGCPIRWLYWDPKEFIKERR